MSAGIERDDVETGEPPVDATYALLTAAAGSLVTVRTRATAYVSTMALATPVAATSPIGR
ncbi:hypothetical protein [Microbacterium sp.]|uniref:hypothetical protein n=1 Tax=Microbacterium sp. TaxID=51671 RepID=UPI0028110D79|nr:hypothetical protein [Microbacterium sp.]